ncbi:MAG: glycosyltransferase family 2 protein [Chloracidobacterium sp.]|nr:glycosyltransferase family 2 protein [Chloracidobacterium sp.]
MELVLKSVFRQRTLPDEILVADDGSTPETKAVVQAFAERSPVPLTHIWHEDNGFRAATIRNKAIARASGPYIIQIDGDIILHRSFIRDHLRSARHGTYLYGTRVRILEKFLPILFSKRQTDFSLFSPGIARTFRALHSDLLSDIVGRPRPFLKWKVLGCNISFWKEDFLSINGYNEEFNGWGLEDTDLAARFHHQGLSGKRLKFNAIAYHIHHPQKENPDLDRNWQVLSCCLEEKTIWAKAGVSQHLAELPNATESLS